jgi:hypothetical protein
VVIWNKKYTPVNPDSMECLAFCVPVLQKADTVLGPAVRPLQPLTW